MAESLGDVIINLRAKDVNLSSGMQGATRELQNLSDKVFSFGGVLRIAFGAQVARAIFHDIHEGIVHLGEGFIEAQRHGESFGDSITDAVRKMAGLKTSYEESAEAAKKFAEEQERLNKALGIIDNLTGENKGDDTYAGLNKAQNKEAKDALVDFPAHVVSAWMGNTIIVAARHYLQTTDAHFAEATGGAA